MLTVRIDVRDTIRIQQIGDARITLKYKAPRIHSSGMSSVDTGVSDFQRFGRWIPTFVGVALLGLVFVFVLVDPDEPLVSLLHVGFAVVLALGLVVLGYRYIVDGGMAGRYTGLVVRWTVIGVAAMTLLNGWFRVVTTLWGTVDWQVATLSTLAAGGFGGTLVGIYHAQSRRRHAEREQALADYEEIFEKAEVGIALNDVERGTVGEVNERYAELMGYSRVELREMTVEKISADHPSFDQEAAMERIQEALEGDPQRFDWLFERKDGSQFWAEVVLKRTFIGQKDRLLAFVRDISGRKQYEQELVQQNQRLDEFASIVSHDLRNPLNVAMGRLEFAQKDCDSEHLEPVVRAHERMEELIEDVLTLARAGESISDTETVELTALVQECPQTVEMASASLVTDREVPVQADETRLRQLLENLLRNAVEHGGDRVTVTVGSLDKGFYLEDDGPGIPKDDRDEVFEAGYSTNQEGTGVGLSIVKQVVEAHGWEICVTESETGGARFEITGVEFAAE